MSDFGRTLRLLPYFMCANSEGFGETANLAWAFAGRLCDKYHNLMSWLKGSVAYLYAFGVYVDWRWLILLYDPSAHRIGCSLKLQRESTNADRKRLKIAFSIANCRFRLPIYNLKRRFKAFWSALLDSRKSSRLPPIRCGQRNFTIKY